MKQDSFQKLPVSPVVCLLEIKLDGHEARLGFTGLKAVEYLLYNDLVFSNPPVWDKG